MQEPPLVARARAAAGDDLGDGRLGPLLHVLARSVGRGRVGAVGLRAATDVAWLAAALVPGVPLVVAEPDASRAAQLDAALELDPDASIVAGGLDSLDADGPFDLLVLGPRATGATPDAALRLLAPHGIAVADGAAAAWPARPELVLAEAADGLVLAARR